MTITQLPGFSHRVHDVQKTFRLLMDVLSRPGKPQTLAANLANLTNLTLPPDINLACATACLTLLDLETLVWFSPGTNETVKNWLLFHTGCRYTTDLEKAEFAVILNCADLLELSGFYPGTNEAPHTSTTLFLQVDSLTGGQPVIFTGPGILGEIHIAPVVPENFWDEWRKNHQAYPLGIDIFLMTETEVMGLPRTTAVEKLR